MIHFKVEDNFGDTLNKNTISPKQITKLINFRSSQWCENKQKFWKTIFQTKNEKIEKKRTSAPPEFDF